MSKNSPSSSSSLRALSRAMPVNLARWAASRPGVVPQQGEVAHHRGQRGLEIVGQEGHQIPLALLALPGRRLPRPELPLDGIQILLDGGQLPGQLHRLRLGLHQPAGGRADVVQPAGKPAHGQVEGDEHQQHGTQGEDLLLVVADIALVELRRPLRALAEQGGGRPEEKAGEGVWSTPSTTTSSRKMPTPPAIRVPSTTSSSIFSLRRVYFPSKTFSSYVPCPAAERCAKRSTDQAPPSSRTSRKAAKRHSTSPTARCRPNRGPMNR